MCQIGRAAIQATFAQILPVKVYFCHVKHNPHRAFCFSGKALFIFSAAGKSNA